MYVNLPAQLQYLAMLVAFTCINNHLKNGSLPLIFITHKWSKMIIYLTQLTTRSTSVASSWSFGWSAVNLACVTSMCTVQRFPGGHSLRLGFGSSFYPHPFPLYSSTDKSGDRCLVPLAWGLVAGGCWFASDGGITLSSGWLCQSGSPWTSRAPTSTKWRSG